MATFTPAFKAEISDDGKTIRFTDQTNWSDNDQGLVISDFTRGITLKDAYGESIGNVSFGAELTAEFNLNANKWVVAKFTIAGTSDFTVEQKYAFYRLFQVAYRDAIGGDCGCGGSSKHICEADAFLHSAEWAIPVGNGIRFQEDIDAANAYLKA